MPSRQEVGRHEGTTGFRVYAEPRHVRYLVYAVRPLFVAPSPRGDRARTGAVCTAQHTDDHGMRGAADGTALVQTQLAGVGQVSRRWGGDGAVQGRAQRGATGTNAHATRGMRRVYIR